MIHIVGIFIDKSDVLYHTILMPSAQPTQQDRAIELLARRGMVRLSEFVDWNLPFAPADDQHPPFGWHFSVIGATHSLNLSILQTRNSSPTGMSFGNGFKTTSTFRENM
ncbi:hypothetical protein Q2941_12100 [Bradyrhizobium sp. UFLA05-153]